MATTPASTVLKAFQVLELFEHRTSLSVSQCASLLRFPRSTAHRLLLTLEAAGVVERPSGGRYQLRLRMFELGSLAPLRRLYAEEARRPLQRLSARTGLPVHLAVREDDVVMFVEVIPGTRYELPTRVGFPAPLHSTAIGKLLLAHAPNEVFETLVSTRVPRFTRHTIESRERLSRELDDIRRSGVAYDHEETHDGLTCVAVPIRTAGDGIRAGVSITYGARGCADNPETLRRSLGLVRNYIENAVMARANVSPGFPLGIPPRRPSEGGGDEGSEDSFSTELTRELL